MTAINSFVSSVTDVGRHRSRNEDSVLALALGTEADRRTSFVLVVADGMGGARGGEVASRTVVETVHIELIRRRLLENVANSESLHDMLLEVYQRCVVALQSRSLENPDLECMGTTLTCLIQVNGMVRFGHVGDSRGYLLRDRELRRLTSDHNVAQQLVECGNIQEHEAASHRGRHVLTNWLDASCGTMKPDTGGFLALPNDLFLLCSDGLYTALPDSRIRELLARSSGFKSQVELDEIAKELVEEANKAGGKDNISVVLATYG